MSNTARFLLLTATFATFGLVIPFGLRGAIDTYKLSGRRERLVKRSYGMARRFLFVCSAVFLVAAVVSKIGDF